MKTIQKYIIARIRLLDFDNLAFNSIQGQKFNKNIIYFQTILLVGTVNVYNIFSARNKATVSITSAYNIHSHDIMSFSSEKADDLALTDGLESIMKTPNYATLGGERLTPFMNIVFKILTMIIFIM